MKAPIATIAAATMLAAFSMTTQAQEAAGTMRVESPPTFRASEILPANLRQGSNFRVEPNVYNDGFNNIYTLTTPYGQYRVESTELLKIRVYELGAVEKLEALKANEEFKKSLGQAAMAPVRFAGDLVTQPVSTVTGAVTGVGSHLKNIGRSLNPERRSAGEEGALRTALGLTEIRRKLAGQVGVDPYSTFPPLVDAIHKVAEPIFAANVGVTAAFAFIPGGVGVGIRASKFSENMNNRIISLAPVELREDTIKRLTGMGVHQQLAYAFVNNTAYTPSTLAYIAGALEAMNGVADRESFIQAAAVARDESVAFYYKEQSEMLAAYHNRIGPLERMVPIGPYVGAKTREGKVVAIFPVDYLAWTESLAGSADGSGAATAKAIGEGEAGELWLAGGISKLAKDELTKRGWKITTDASEKLRLQ